MTIREKLYDYIRFADEQKINAIYTLIRDDIKSSNVPWDNSRFIEHLEAGVEEYRNQKESLKSWEEIKAELKS